MHGEKTPTPTSPGNIGPLLVFSSPEVAKEWLIAHMMGDGRDRGLGNVRYYAEIHVTYEPLAQYMGSAPWTCQILFEG